MKTHHPSKQIVAFVAVLVLAGCSVVYGLTRRQNDVSNKGNTSTIAEDGTRFSGPTDQEKEDAQTNKEKLADAKPMTAPQNGEKYSVVPVITSMNQYELRAYVPGVVEENGICTATFTKGSQSFRKTSGGLSNASNTMCAPIAYSRNDFPLGGGWSVVLSYNSAKAEGSSQSSTLEVQ